MFKRSRLDNKGRVLRIGESQRKQDGRYVYTYMNPWKERCYVYAKTLAELREKEDKLKRDQLDGIMSYKEGVLTLNELVDRYLNLKKLDLALSTWSNYRYVYDHFCKETIGRCKVTEIRYSDLLYFYKELIEREISVKTLESIHCVLHPAFNMAMRDDVIRRNPSDNIISELKKSCKKQESKISALTLEQQTRFMDYVEKHPIFRYWFSLFTILLWTGARIGEVCGLRWQDVDFENRMIHINHSMTYFKRWNGEQYKCGFKVGGTKTMAGTRDIPMLNEVYEVLQTEYEKQKEEGFSKLVVDGMTGFVFINRSSSLHRHSSIDHSLKRIVKCYNEEEELNAQKEGREPVLLPYFSCHTFRHTFCTRLCEADMNLKVIQEIMGHRDIKTTLDIYTQISGKKKQESLEKFEKMMDNMK